MNNKYVVIIGALDTKGEHLLFLRDRIKQNGLKAIVIDLSMGSEPLFQADITSQDVAQAGGGSIEEIRASRDRAMITQIMEKGAIEKIKQLHSAGKVNGIIALGGTSIALMGSYIMKVLPFGIPKIIVCSAAMPAYVARWFDTLDVAVMQCIVEFAGLNQLVERALVIAAGAISGMVKEIPAGTDLHLTRGSIAITQLGFSENCALYVRKYLEKRGYAVYPFHAQGTSDRAMEELITQGHFDGVIDIVPAGVIEEIFEGNRAAGPKRLEAAGERGIPQVIAPCEINLTGCGPTRKNNDKYISRERVLKIDELRAGTRYNVEELKIGAGAYAEKLNRARGPVSILIPLRGWSSLDREGSILYDPKEDKIFVEELRGKLRPDIEIEEIDCNLEDPEFALALVEKLDNMLQERG